MPLFASRRIQPPSAEMEVVAGALARRGRGRKDGAHGDVEVDGC